MAHVKLMGKRGTARRLADEIAADCAGIEEQVDGGNLVLYGKRIKITRQMIRRACFPGKTPAESSVTGLMRWLMGRGEPLARVTHDSLVFADTELPE